MRKHKEFLFPVVVVLLFGLFAFQLWFHATRTSATIDESPHILAGYRYWQCGDFGINPRFEGAYFLLNDFDNNVARLRASEEGRHAINALKRAIERMRSAGYAVKKDGYDPNNGLLGILEADSGDSKGINDTDRDIQNTLWFVYKIKVFDAELLEFSNYLTEHHPEYPSWSERTRVENREESPIGFSVKYITYILKNPERYHEAYLEFKNSKH